MKAVNAGELCRPSIGVDPETPGSPGGCPKRLLVGPVAPATDGLSQRHCRNDRVRPPEERLPRAEAKKGERCRPGDERAVECEPAESNVDRLCRMCQKMIDAQCDII